MANISKIYSIRFIRPGIILLVFAAITLSGCAADKHNLLSKGLGHYEQGQYNQAISLCIKVIELDPRLEAAYACLGNVYYSQKRYNRSIAAYEKVLKLSNIKTGWKSLRNALARAYYNVGMTYLEHNEYIDAVAKFEKAIVSDPKYLPPYIEAGMIYYRQRRDDEAIVKFKKMIALDRSYSSAYYYLGRIYNEKKEGILARQYFIQAARLDHADASSQLSKSEAYEIDVCRKLRATAYENRSSSLPERVEDLLTTAETYMRTNRYNRAKRLYLRAIKLVPWYPAVRLDFAAQEAEKENYGEAILQMRCYMELSPDSQDSNSIQNQITEWEMLKEN